MKKLIYIPISMMFLYACESSDKITPSEYVQQTGNTSVAGSIGLSARLWGYTAIPTNSSHARGTLTGSVDLATNEFGFQVTYDSMVPSEAHIHKAAYPNVGPVVHMLILDGTQMMSGKIKLTQDEINQLANGYYYVDIHSRSFPEGEIRGQIEKSE